MSQPHPSKPLSVAQVLILRTTAERPDGMVLPLPASLGVRGASQTRVLAALLKAGLVEEVDTADAALRWRKGEERALRALCITPAGLAAIGHPKEPPVELPIEPPSTPAVPRPGGKLGAVLDAVRAAQGATLADLVTATGWQPHTTRAAITGLRKRGFHISLAERNGRKAYGLAEAG